MWKTKTSRCIWITGLCIMIYTIGREANRNIPIETTLSSEKENESEKEVQWQHKLNVSYKTFLDDKDKIINTTNSADQWLAEQQKRANDIKKECTGWRKNPELFLPSHRDNLTYLLVDDRHKAIYCYIAKVACTNWKKLWMVLTGLTKARDVNSIPDYLPHKLHSRMMLMKQSNKISIQQDKLNTYKKFLIVRHPYHRILSAYKDKFEGKGRAFYKKNYARYIMRNYRSNSSSDNIPPSGDGLTFPEFVSYINDLPRGGFDEHWKPFTDTCFPCAIRYDVIAKYETLEEDSERFLRLIRAPDYLHFPPFRISNTSKSLTSYMRMLSPQQRKALFITYEKDFKMFQYTDNYIL